MSKQTEYYIDCWFKVDYDIIGSAVEFEARRIETINEETPTESPLEPSVAVKGRIKWDGCIEFKQEDHYCGIHHAEQTLILFRHIYDFVKQLEVTSH